MPVEGWNTTVALPAVNIQFSEVSSHWGNLEREGSKHVFVLLWLLISSLVLWRRTQAHSNGLSISTKMAERIYGAGPALRCGWTQDTLWHLGFLDGQESCPFQSSWRNGSDQLPLEILVELPENLHKHHEQQLHPDLPSAEYCILV